MTPLEVILQKTTDDLVINHANELYLHFDVELDVLERALPYLGEVAIEYMRTVRSIKRNKDIKIKRTYFTNSLKNHCNAVWSNHIDRVAWFNSLDEDKQREVIQTEESRKQMKALYETIKKKHN